MRLPRVQRARRLQDRAVALDRLDFARDGRDDPVADFVEDEEGVVRLLIEDLRPDDPGGARLREFDRDGEAIALALQRSADDIVDVQHPAGLFRADAPLAECEDGALRNDEKASQLGKPGDHVVGEAAGRAAMGRRSRRSVRQTASPQWMRGAAQRSTLSGAPSGAARARRSSPGPSRAPSPCALAARQISRMARAIEALGLEQSRRRRQMLLSLPDAAAPGERVQKNLVDALVERRELEPFLQISEHLLAGRACRRDVPAARRGSRESGAAGP